MDKRVKHAFKKSLAHELRLKDLERELAMSGSYIDDDNYLFKIYAEQRDLLRKAMLLRIYFGIPAIKLLEDYECATDNLNRFVFKASN